MKQIIFFLVVFSQSIFLEHCDASQNTLKFAEKNQDMKDDKHGLKMGIVFPGCDDAEVRYFPALILTNFVIYFCQRVILKLIGMAHH